MPGASPVRPRRSTPASDSCPPTARREARSWCVRSRRTWPSPAGRAWRAGGCSATGSEAGAFQRWRERLSIRSRNDPSRRWVRCPAATSRRCCSRAGWSATRRALVLVEPTRGVDVGAREDIYRSLRALAARWRRGARRHLRLRGGGPGRRSGVRDGQGPDRGRISRGRGQHEPAPRSGRRLGGGRGPGSAASDAPRGEALDTGVEPGEARVARPRHRSRRARGGSRPGDGGAGSRPRRPVRLLLDRVAILLQRQERHRHPAAGGRASASLHAQRRCC